MGGGLSENSKPLEAFYTTTVLDMPKQTIYVGLSADLQLWQMSSAVIFASRKSAMLALSLSLVIARKSEY
ncbi:hypothetical protein V6N11_006160 [Hibiscus sabdariffa]|uniref:Uncharacterized protein n=1 Tax=Hibiscus sabdariffa TaxID=183260 RepID=A0ABR2RQ04_9ROSI